MKCEFPCYKGLTISITAPARFLTIALFTGTLLHKFVEKPAQTRAHTQNCTGKVIFIHLHVHTVRRKRIVVAAVAAAAAAATAAECLWRMCFNYKPPQSRHCDPFRD